jgi:hypothetical protein
MSIDMSKLENIKSKGEKIIARCPACAETGQDKKGNHLIINNDGKFACVMFPGSSGYKHRKRIFQLTGIIDPPKNIISVKEASQASHTESDVMMDDVLGRIGHHFLSHYKKPYENKIDKLVRLSEEINIETDHAKRKMKEQTFTVRWEKLEGADRKELVDRLLDEGLLPDTVRQVLAAFDGAEVILMKGL